MDAIVDACHGFINTFYGTCTPSMPKENEEEDEGEDGGTE